MARDIRQGTRDWSRNLWSRIKALFSGLDDRVTALEQGGGGGGGAVSGVKGDAESTYRTGNVNLTPANLGITLPLTIANGGTGAKNAADARANLGVPSTSEMNAAIAQSTAFDSSGGGYCKLTDGTMIQWGRVSGIAFDNAASVSGTISLPYAYNTQNSYQVICTPVNTGDSRYAFRVAASPSGVDTINWTLYSGTNDAITVNSRQFSWIAIGRWKQQT